MIEDKEIPYTLVKRRRHRSFTLSVHAGGRVILTVPKRISDTQAERFLFQKKQWLIDAFSQAPEKRGLSHINREHYKTHKEKARQLVYTRLEALNTQYGFVYNKVCIRANTTRWGSCSEHGNLNFDYRILFLSNHLQDYVLTHELCHLQEMNHSKQFWNLVQKTVPDYAKRKAELRKQEV